MTEVRNTTINNTPFSYNTTEDLAVMQKVRKIVAKGNNVEIKRAKDGSLTIMEVKKHKV